MSGRIALRNDIDRALTEGWDEIQAVLAEAGIPLRPGHRRSPAHLARVNYARPGPDPADPSDGQLRQPLYAGRVNLAATKELLPHAMTERTELLGQMDSRPAAPASCAAAQAG